MNFIGHLFDTPIALGYSVILPLLLLVIGLVVRLKVVKALQAGLTATFCLVGAAVLISRFTSSLLDLGRQMTQASGVTMAVTDVGWRASSLIASASRIGLYIVPMCILINLVLLLAKATRTINLDIWSYWQCAFVGAMAESLTGSFAGGMITACAAVILFLVVADNTAGKLQKYCDVPGVSLAHGFAAGPAPVLGLFNWVLDKIPGLRRFRVTFPSLHKKIGFLADPALWSVIAATILGLLAARPLGEILPVSFQVGAVVFLVPRIMEYLGQCITPIAEGLERFSREKLGLHTSLTLGLTSTVGLGNSTVLFISLLLTPLAIPLAARLPGNLVLPDSDLVMIPYLIIFAVLLARGDLIRSLIGGIGAIVLSLYASTGLAGLTTQAAAAADPETYGALTQSVSNLFGSGNPITWVLVSLSRFGVSGWGMILILALAAAMWNYNRMTGNVKLYVKKPKPLLASSIDEMKKEAEQRRSQRKQAVSQKRAALRAAVAADLEKRNQEDGGAEASVRSDSEESGK